MDGIAGTATASVYVLVKLSVNSFHAFKSHYICILFSIECICEIFDRVLSISPGTRYLLPARPLASTPRSDRATKSSPLSRDALSPSAR